MPVMVGRVWDLRTGRSIMTLQGHVKGVMALSFSPNGFLLASGSEDHAARIWDLRKRKCVYTIPCHSSLVSQVWTACFARKAWLEKACLPMSLMLMAYTRLLGTQVIGELHSDLSAPFSTLLLLCNSCNQELMVLGHTTPAIWRYADRLAFVQVCFEPSEGHYLLTAGYDNVAKLWSASDFHLVRTLAGHEGKVMGADINPHGDGTIATVGYDRTVKLWSPEA